MLSKRKIVIRALASHAIGQSLFLVLFFITIYSNYTEAYIDQNKVAFILGISASIGCIFVLVNHFLSYWNFQEQLNLRTYGPPLAFIGSLLFWYFIDGLVQDVSKQDVWLNLIMSLLASIPFFFVKEEKGRQEQQEPNEPAKKEEVFPMEIPFISTPFQLQVGTIWNQITALDAKFESSSVEEKHALENMQREIQRMNRHYIRLPIEKREEANAYVADVLSKMEARLSLMEEDVYQEDLNGIKKIQMKYEV